MRGSPRAAAAPVAIVVAALALAACDPGVEREGADCPAPTVVESGDYLPDGAGPTGTAGYWLASGTDRRLEFDRASDTLTVRYVRGGQEVVEVWRVAARSP